MVFGLLVRLVAPFCLLAPASPLGAQTTLDISGFAATYHPQGDFLYDGFRFTTDTEWLPCSATQSFCADWQPGGGDFLFSRTYSLQPYTLRPTRFYLLAQSMAGYWTSGTEGVPYPDVAPHVTVFGYQGTHLTNDEVADQRVVRLHDRDRHDIDAVFFGQTYVPRDQRGFPGAKVKAGIDDLTYSETPEPATLMLTGAGLASLAAWRKRRKQSAGRG